MIGASAGGVEALRDVVAGLPRDFPAALFVVLHVPPHGPRLLPAWRGTARVGLTGSLADGARGRAPVEK